MHEVAATEMVDRLQPEVVIAKRPMAVCEDAFVGGGRNHLREAGVVRVLGMRFANQSAFKPGGAARLDERYAECWSGPCGNPVASELVDVAAALAADSVGQVDQGSTRNAE